MRPVPPARQADNPPPGKIFNCAIAPTHSGLSLEKPVKSKSIATVVARRVIIWSYAGVFIGVALLSGVFFFQTYQEYAHLRQVEAATRQRLAQAEKRLQDQARVLDRLRNDPAFVEKIIRLQLHYAKPSELIFRFDE
jgi:cell division protein DivIC